MEIVFHIGAHRAGGRELVRSLLNHRDTLLKQGIAVPGPSRYTELIGQAANSLRGEIADDETRETILSASLDLDDAERIIFSNESFMCLPLRALDEGRLYARAFKTEWLRNLFPRDEVEFALSLKNQATFLSEIYKTFHANGVDWDAAMPPGALAKMRWSEVVSDIRRINPDTPITVWCQEDTPLIWPEVIREVSGHDPYTSLDVGTDILSKIMRREGVRKLRAYLEERPVETETARRRVVSAFLDKYYVPHRVEEEIEVPGWTDDDTEIASQMYEDDIDAIARMPGVRLITP